MSRDIEINVEHVTRVEGHGNIVLNVKKGRIEKIEWQVSEAPRFFEAMLRGRNYDELRPVTSRICGICSIAHSIASLKATEDALGVRITEQTGILRRLAINAENMQSHILHVGYLALPDIFDVGSVFPLVKTKHKDTLLKIVELHRLANWMSDLICGRTTHPIRLIIGGFSSFPTEKQLLELRNKLKKGLGTIQEIAEIIHGVSDKLPVFKRETEYIALSSKEEYALYDGDIVSTDAGRYSNCKDYEKIANEYFVPHSTAFFCKNKRDSYMVGALARFNLNSKQLSPAGKELARLFGLKSINCNPFMNNVAQVVEFAHNLEDSINLVDRLVEKGVKDEKPVEFKIKKGRGIGLVEAPRGLLIHDYTLDDRGKCVKANCVIPTNQNHGNIQKDLEAFVPEILDRSEDEIRLNLEMLVRAYDPCISCSTHYLDVEFV